MAETTEIEKKSLEAHVELCAERYRSLDDRLDAVNDRIGGVELIVREVHDMIQNMAEKRNDQIINWGLGIIGTMTVIIGFFLVKYVVN